MRKFLIGLRTTKFDIQTLSLFLYYKNANIDVVLVVDELKKDVDCGIFPKVSINKSTLTEVGLYVELEKLGWLCGDFGLYLMSIKYPNYDGYWLIEDDALVASESLTTYLGLPLLKSFDLCAKSFWNAHSGWVWKESAEAYFQVPIAKKMSFSIVYVSRKFCREAFQKRVEYIQFFSNCTQSTIFLNDESFLANFSKNYNAFQMEKLYSEDDLKNYHFTTNNKLFFFNPTFSKIEQGFYHPIIISSNSQDNNLRIIHILKKQKQLGRYYKNKLLNQMTNNLESIQKEFTPRVLVCILYSGSAHILTLVESLKARWVQYVIINLTSQALDIEATIVYQTSDIVSGLAMIEKDHQNHDGLWIITDRCSISLDSKQSLVKTLELPEWKNIPFCSLKIGDRTLTGEIIYYINFEYYKEKGFCITQAQNIQELYHTEFFTLKM